MSISQLESGTRTTAPVEGAFTSLGTNPRALAGVFQLVLDLTNMQSGDTIVVHSMEKAVAAGSQVIEWERTYTYSAGLALEPLLRSPGLIGIHGWGFQMKQTVGGSRNFDWSIRQIV